MRPWLTKITSYFVRILGAFLIVFVILAFAEGLNYLSITGNRGTAGYETTWSEDNDSVLVISSVLNEYPAYQAGIGVGDTIVKVNNVRVIRGEFDVNKVVGVPEVGKKVELTILKGGIEKNYTLVFVSLPLVEKFMELLFRIIPALLMLAYVLVGFWGVIRSPYSSATILIAMLCFCLGSFMYATIDFSVRMDTFISKYLFFHEIRIGIRILAFFASSFWILLFATFPFKIPFYEKHRFVSYLFIFLLPILMLISILFELKPNSLVIIALVFTNIAVGVLLLSYNTKQAKTALERRQARLMLLGVKYGAIAMGLGWMVVLFTEFIISDIPSFLEYAGLTALLLGEMGGLLIPFTFLNSFFQNRLLETETALKKRIRYVGVTLVLLSVYLFFIFLIGKLWISWFNITDPTLIIILVLFVSLTFTPINKRILKWLEEKFYPEKTKYIESLKHFIENASSYLEPGELLHHLSDWARSTTGVFTAIPVPLEPKPFYPPFRIDEDNSIFHRIRDGNKFFWDEITDKSRVPVNELEFEWAKDNDISVTIPMISHGELLGTLNVGRKINSEDFTAEDLDILTQASNQTALALQNIKLQYQYIEKKRMDKELEMARNIQEKLMPQIIPHVKGLDIIGKCIPCHEVAGDYFDIINMEDGKTVLVVADVSGKGAGAAMIMANLQASIRLGVHLSDKLADFVTRINNLIHNNTSPAEFITFFIAIWDPSKKVLYYVNAGHNPPIFIDRDNHITKLEATGLILGVLPDQIFEEKYTRMPEGSLLAVYTDGLEEALSENYELYGQARIIKTLAANKNKSAIEISRALSEDVLQFTGGKSLYCDDITLILAKSI